MSASTVKELINKIHTHELMLNGAYIAMMKPCKWNQDLQKLREYGFAGAIDTSAKVTRLRRRGLIGSAILVLVMRRDSYEQSRNSFAQ